MKEIKETNFNQWIITAIILVLIIFSIIWSLNRYWYEIPPTAAEFGDSFGLANVIFSALAFAFLIVTALMQRKELELQRKELTETRRELKKAAEAQEASQKALNSQVSIISKQALVSSYESMYNANISISESGGSAELSRTQAILNINEFYNKMVKVVQELEKEKKYYHDPFLKEKLQDEVKNLINHKAS